MFNLNTYPDTSPPLNQQFLSRVMSIDCCTWYFLFLPPPPFFFNNIFILMWILPFHLGAGLYWNSNGREYSLTWEYWGFALSVLHRMRVRALTDLSPSRRGADVGQFCGFRGVVSFFFPFSFPICFQFHSNNNFKLYIQQREIKNKRRNPNAPELLYCMREFN